MFHYISLSTDTRIPSSSALVVTLRATVDGSLVAVSTNGVIASHFVVNVSCSLMALGRAGTGGAGVSRILAKTMRPAVEPSWETCRRGRALIVCRLGDW